MLNRCFSQLPWDERELMKTKSLLGNFIISRKRFFDGYLVLTLRFNLAEYDPNYEWNVVTQACNSHLIYKSNVQ